MQAWTVVQKKWANYIPTKHTDENSNRECTYRNVCKADRRMVRDFVKSNFLCASI